MGTLLTITRSNTHGHTAFLYNTAEERLEVLSKYFQQGLEKNELCVLVSAEEPDDVAGKFMEMDFDVRQPLRTGALRIFGMEDTYLPGGHFAANYMLANVGDFIKEAKSLGYSGLRTAGEMSWIYDHPQYNEAAKDYEDRVNELGNKHPDFIGLCLYPVRKHFAQVLHDVSYTHPSLISEGQLHLNHQYHLAN